MSYEYLGASSQLFRNRNEDHFGVLVGVKLGKDSLVAGSSKQVVHESLK